MASNPINPIEAARVILKWVQEPADPMGVLIEGSLAPIVAQALLEAVEALRPFAKCAEFAEGLGVVAPEKTYLWSQSQTSVVGPQGGITVADVQCARAFLEKHNVK